MAGSGGLVASPGIDTTQTLTLTNAGTGLNVLGTAVLNSITFNNGTIQTTAGGNGGSAISAVQQNVANEKAGLPAIQIKNAGWDSYTDNTNISYALTTNYTVSSNIINLTCVLPESTFKPIYPCRLIVYDTVNKSYATLTSNVSGTIYSLSSPLLNQSGIMVGYTSATSAVKLRTKNRTGNLAAVSSTLTGQIATTPEDLLTKYLENYVTNGKLTVFRTFNSEEFLITSKPTTTTTKISSATNKSPVFQIGTNFIAYHKKYTGVNFQSMFNSGLLKNFDTFTCSASGTYSGTEITLTHATKSNANILTTDYYIMKLPSTLAIVENDNQAGTPNTLTVKDFILGLSGGFLFSDNLNRGDGAIGNNWITTQDFLFQPGGTSNTGLQISGNKLYQYSVNTGAICQRIVRNLEDYSKNKNLILYAKVQNYNGGGGQNSDIGSTFIFYTRDVVYGSWGGLAGTAEGISVRYLIESGVYYIRVYSATTLIFSTSTSLVNNTQYNVAIKSNITQNSNKATIYIKTWAIGGTEPSTWDYTVEITSPSLTGNYFGIHAHTASGGVANSSTGIVYIDDIVLNSTFEGSTAIYEQSGVSGDKVTISTPTDITASSLESQLDIGVGFICQ